ncbi:MAG: hypothetical protein JWM12_3272 [Ilumatobacteraceae bacterium]|nr:hypothetical protein [Ilumatobacteraceae bacterium]
MIEHIDDLAAGVVGMSAVGQFTIEDYTNVVEPVLDALSAVHEQLRLLLYLGPAFTGFGAGAWGELTDEIRHTHFHKGAVVTDDAVIRTGLNVLKWVLHGDVRTFQNDDYDKAAHWIAT